MANNLQRAEYWKRIILSKSKFPAPELLLAQFEAADFLEFCDCGCNSFKVQTRPGECPPPIAQSGSYGAVFEADFRIEVDEKTIEIILFTGEDGNLAYVEIDC